MQNKQLVFFIEENTFLPFYIQSMAKTRTETWIEQTLFLDLHIFTLGTDAGLQSYFVFWISFIILTMFALEDKQCGPQIMFLTLKQELNYLMYMCISATNCYQ